jgi:hypothetical protein
MLLSLRGTVMSSSTSAGSVATTCEGTHTGTHHTNALYASARHTYIHYTWPQYREHVSTCRRPQSIDSCVCPCGRGYACALAVAVSVFLAVSEAATHLSVLCLLQQFDNAVGVLRACVNTHRHTHTHTRISAPTQHSLTPPSHTRLTLAWALCESHALHVYTHVCGYAHVSLCACVRQRV